MKRTIPVSVLVLAAALVAPHPTRAQMPSSTLDEQRAAIDRLAGLVGAWKGEGWVRMGPGPEHRFAVEESVEEKLDGVALLVEGRGTAPGEDGAERVVHQALAVVAWDAAADRYVFTTHTALGHHAVTSLEILDDGKLRWGLTTSDRDVRYTIDLSTAGTWHEMGEVSMDGGATWMHFHDMTLKRVE